MRLGGVYETRGDSVETEGHSPNRRSVSLQIGELVSYRNRIYRLSATVDFSHMVGVDVIIGTSKLLPIVELKRVSSNNAKGDYLDCALDDIADEKWAEAERRWAIILPLILGDLNISGAVEARARECNVSRATIYRWISSYMESGEFLALVPGKPGWKKGISRLSTQVEDIVAEAIKLVYLAKSRASIVDVHEAVKVACETAGLVAPSLPAVSERINRIPKKVRLRARGYSEDAYNNYEPKPSRYSADYPLQRIQIDHTPADIVIVDDVYRRPIGRPWVSLAIDMYSRMIVGYYLSLEAPSALSVAMCLVHTMLPKHNWLKLHGIDGEWNAWGKPDQVHSDNGPDFRAGSLIKSCSAHDIDRQFRPRKKPHWGGHIESLMNTKARAFATLPGATARNVDERGDVNSDKEAVVSFSALEKWLVAQIIIYNNKSHSGIGYMPPTEKWNEAFFGSADKGIKSICALPSIPESPISLEIDFLPSAEKTVQTYGVEWNAFYYAEVLRPWIGMTDPVTKKSQKLNFRRDPRDINFIWFFEPNERKYYKIPIADEPFSGVTVKAYRLAKLEVKKRGLSLQNSFEIRKQLAYQKELIADEAEKSKSARRQQQRDRNRAASATPATTYVDPPKQQVPIVEEVAIMNSDSWGDDEVDLYGGVA